MKGVEKAHRSNARPYNLETRAVALAIWILEVSCASTANSGLASRGNLYPSPLCHLLAHTSKQQQSLSSSMRDTPVVVPF